MTMHFSRTAFALFVIAIAGSAPALAQPNLPPVRIKEIVPNPLVDGTTRISFLIPSPGSFDVAIYSVDGSLVADVGTGEAGGGGVYTVTWDGRARDGSFVANGLYYCRIRFGKAVQASPLLVMR